MTERQFEGRSVAEAAIKACEVLDTTRSALRYKVISETGELLERRVVIAVDVANTVPTEPVADTTRPPRRSEAPTTGSDEGASEEAPPRTAESADSGEARRGGRGGRGGRSSEGRGGDRNTRSAGGRGGRERSDRGERSERPASRGPRTGGRPRAQDDEGIEALLKLDNAPEAPIVARPAIEATSPRAKKAVGVVGDLVRLMHLQLKAQLVADDDTEMHIDLVGTDESRVIGRKGEVLLALQFVTNRMISRGEEEGDQVVVLDAGGYRQRRRNALQELAKRLAGRALEERKAVRLSPMSAHDRRVFHLTLKEIEGVTTRSEGDGLYRNLLIIPSEFC